VATENLTINEALIWLKTLRTRHTELIALRNENSTRETRYYGANADKQVEKTPVYDIRKLDTLVNGVAKEIRQIEMAIKQANATTNIGRPADESVLGNIE